MIHRASDNHTGCAKQMRPGDQSSGSNFEPLSFRQMTWCNYLKVPAVKGGDLMQVQSFGERYHASINHLEPQR